MADLTQAFFADIAERKYDSLLHSVSGSIRWDIEEKDSWYVIVKNGELTVTKKASPADTTCSITKEDFERVVVGKQNLFTLLLQMKASCTGNLGLLQVFQRVFPDKNILTKGDIYEQNN